MQLISTNGITQGMHGTYNAVDIGPSPDPYYYAPEDGIVTLADSAPGDSTCGTRLKVKGATGEHGFCHNDIIYVKLGQAVKRGQKLAKMGYTGLTDPDNVPAGTHVHWILNINGVWVYPPTKVNQSFIKLGEVIVSKDALTATEVDLTYLGVVHRHVDPSGAKTWLGKPFTKLVTALRASSEYAKQAEAIKNYDKVKAELAAMQAPVQLTPGKIYKA